MDKSKLLTEWLQQKKADSQLLEKKPEDSPNRLSYGQRRLYFLQQMNPKSPFYNYPELYTLRGKWDIDRFKKCIHEVSGLHGIFYHNFRLNSDHEPEIVINHDRDPVLIEHLYLSEIEDGKSLHEIFVKKGRYLFDLAEDMLFRVTIVTISEHEHQILFNLHHIITDKWSVRIFRNQLIELYESYTSSIATNLIEENSNNYLDYSYHQTKTKITEQEINYWKEKVSSSPEEISLPIDHKPSKITHNGKLNITNLPPELTKKIKQLAREQETTLFIFFLSVFKILLHRYSEVNTIRVGTPISNRNRKEWESIFGFFIETVLLQTRIEPDNLFQEYLQQVKKDVLEAFDNKKVPYEKIVSQLSNKRETNKNPLFRTMFLFNHNEAEKKPLGGLEMEFKPLDIGVAKFDLSLFVDDDGNNFKITFEYATDYFEDETIDRMHMHFQTLLEEIIADSNQKICDLRILHEEEISQIEKWNETDFEARPIPIHKAIEDIALNNPYSVAVTDSNGHVTYKELNERANVLANKIQEFSEPKKRIGLFFGRQSEMIIAMMGTLKSGCSYVPLDPSYPQERIQYILEDANIELIVSSSNCIEKLDTRVDKIVIEEIGSTPVQQLKSKTQSINDEAYVIYTSGSTGKPKGVSITHKNLYYSTSARPIFYDNMNPTCFLLFSSFSFDSSIAGIYWTLLKGGNLLISEERAEQDIQQIAKLIHQQKVSHTLFLPSLYKVLLQETDINLLESLEIIIVAGEACSTEVIEHHFNYLSNTKLYNEYGPTEATVWCIAHDVSLQDSVNRVPIGRPIPGSKAYILDSNMQRVPIGVTGELYIGGEGISDGYIGKASADNDRFIDNPFDQGQIYKTGDVASYRKDGRIDFWGRIDNQIKIRGHRVELNEIERVLASLKQIRHTKVIFEDSRQQLIAFITQDQKSELQEKEIKQHLKEFLPQYMIPSKILLIEDFPRLPNGKIDQQQLMDMNIHSHQEEKETPQEGLKPIEKELIEIWNEVLNQSNIGVNDNYFALGGDSISSIRIVSKAKAKGIHLSPTQIFETQTIKEISSAIVEKESTEGDFKTIIPLKPDGRKPPLFCIHSGGANVFIYKKLAESIGFDYPVYAIQPKGLDGGEMYNSVEEMSKDYFKQILDITNQKKCYVLGYCFSKIVCLELARLAKEQDIEMGLIIVDSAALPWKHRQRLLGENKIDPFLRFGKKILEGNWKGIKRVIQRNLESVSEKFEGSTEAHFEEMIVETDSENEHQLVRMIMHLNRFVYEYHWNPVQTKVHLIRSSEYVNLKNKDYHIDVWKTLSKNNLITYQIEGYHDTLFEGNSVVEMAKTIEEIIQNEA